MFDPPLAHGIGGRSDLPLELSFFLVGGGVVLVVSFVALALLWPHPRLQDGPLERPVNAPWLGPLARASAGAGLGAYLLVLVAGLVGRDNGSANIVPVIVWVVVWLVVPFASAVVGNVWSAISPWATLTRTLRFGEDDPDAMLRLGVYPAVVAFIAFVWLELISSDSGSPRSLALAMVAYSFYVFAFASWVGPNSGLRVAEFFSTYNRLISSISPFGRSKDGRLVWRGWLRALPVTQQLPGLTLFIVAMIGTVTYDGLSGTPWLNETLGGWGLDPTSASVQSVSLIATVAVIGAAYWVASWAAAALGGGDQLASYVADRFAHTLVPIALAYAVAHYFTLVVFEGQLLYIHASDPLGLGWNILGTANWTVQFWMSPTAVWYVQVALIVLGHVAGVVLAHDRALADFKPQLAVRTQYAMLVLMVLLTGLGLTILAVG